VDKGIAKTAGIAYWGFGDGKRHAALDIKGAEAVIVAGVLLCRGIPLAFLGDDMDENRAMAEIPDITECFNEVVKLVSRNGADILASKSMPGVKNPLKLSSLFFRTCRMFSPMLEKDLRRCFSSSLARTTCLLVIFRLRKLESAPTLGEIDISLSLRMTMRFLLRWPAWLSASKAMPPVMEPSPITAMTRLLHFLRCFAMAMPRPAEIEVELWPVSKVS
jgi:hypothetical protein